MLYTTDRHFSELGVIQQNIQLARHATHGACPHLGLPFRPRDLSAEQLDRYRALWK